jgi:AraC family transcriptional regulator of adaptative response / DNA-3-methyladenine glycosylase II
MNLDPDICYSAVASRDRRFDGRFFTAVRSTGVYCRPVCPALTPKRENCTFFPCAAAAEEAGYRPCRRCRPETSPGTPAWAGTSATVARAMKLIAEGALDRHGVERLAARLGVGDRHLRRLFLRHLGASPLAVALTRRVHFAKKLIDETRLPMAQVALTTGFGSIRRFNAAILKTYGRSPTQIRAIAAAPRPQANDHLLLRLAYRAPFDWPAVVAFLGPRAIPGVEAAERTVYRRTVAIEDVRGLLEVRPATEGDHLELRLPYELAPHLARIVPRVRDLFDLAADPQAIADHLSREPFIGRLVKKRPGLRVPGCWDRFELAVRAILGQQITVQGATRMAGRLVRAFGEPLDESLAGGLDGELGRIFPGPERLANEDLTSVGLTKARAGAIRGLARAVLAGDLSLEPGASLEESIVPLVRLRGLGDWTAQYIAMRALGEPDAFPSGDLGLRRALAGGVGSIAGKCGPLRPGRLQEIAEVWRPWRAYAAMHLWLNSLSGG